MDLYAAERHNRCVEAVQECFVTIFATIDQYDPSKGLLTTYCKRNILGAITEWEAKRRGRGSKQTLNADRNVSNAEMRMIAQGKTPSARLISLETGEGIEQVLMSKARIEAENTMVSVESDEGKSGVANKKSQSIFDSPEAAFVSKEKTAELMEALDILTDIEKEVLLSMHGIKINGTQFEDTKTAEDDNIYEIANKLNIKSNAVKRIYNSAIQKLKNQLGAPKGNDKLL